MVAIHPSFLIGIYRNKPLLLFLLGEVADGRQKVVNRIFRGLYVDDQALSVQKQGLGNFTRFIRNFVERHAQRSWIIPNLHVEAQQKISSRLISETNHACFCPTDDLRANFL